MTNHVNDILQSLFHAYHSQSGRVEHLYAVMQGIVCGVPDDGVVLLYLAVAAQSALEGSENGV
jgi:hypothetical protein